MKQKLRYVLGPLILLATITAFIYYVTKHPAVVEQIKHIPPLTLLGILGLNALGFLSLVIITRVSLLAYGKTMGIPENLLFNAYSSLINFFGPGQSGPIFRAAYLKKRHALGVKQFTFVMLFYYAFYAIISCVFVLAGGRPWWLITLAVGLISTICVWAIRHYMRRSNLRDGPTFNAKMLGFLFVATAVQMVFAAATYGLELHSIHAHASLSQVLAYTGVANLALFVALTPGGIGIRESFLLFSSHLHHLPASAIVAASVLDRAAYLVFLGILFVLVIVLHAKKRLGVDTKE